MIDDSFNGNIKVPGSGLQLVERIRGVWRYDGTISVFGSRYHSLGIYLKQSRQLGFLN